jgi:hypothetical protein
MAVFPRLFFAGYHPAEAGWSACLCQHLPDNWQMIARHLICICQPTDWQLMSHHAVLPSRLTPPAILANLLWLKVAYLYTYSNYSFLREVSEMKNTVIRAAIVASFLALGGCSTYNTYAPDWAKMGGSETKTEATSEAATDGAESSWWNPFSW